MKAIITRAPTAPDRQFLLWILFSLIVATVVTGTTAMIVALTNIGGV